MSVVRQDTASWGMPVLVGLFLAVCYLLTFSGSIAPRISDGRSIFLVTRSLVDRHDVAVTPSAPDEVAVAPGWHALPLPGGACPVEPSKLAVGERIGGPYFSKYGIGQSVAAAPLYFLGTLTARAYRPVARAEVDAFVTSLYNPVVTALTAMLLCALALRLGWSRRTALALALVFGLATPAWAYTGTFFSEPTIGFCLIGIVAAVLWRDDVVIARGSLLAGCWLAAALLVRLDSALYVPVIGGFLLARGERARWPLLLAAFAVPVAVGVAAVGAFNAARFGSPFISGYGIIGDYHDLHPPHTLQGLWEGIYGPLLSPGKGLVLYAPVLLLLPWALGRFARMRRAGTWLIGGICAVAVLSHANTLIVWLGGWAWGPRFLIPILPVAMVPLGALLQEAGATMRRIAWVLAGLGALIQVPAVLLDKGLYIRYLRDSTHRCIWQVEDLYKWHPQYTPLIGQWQRLFDAGTYMQASPSAQEIGRGRGVPEPQTWWGLLAAQGVSHMLLAAVLLSLGVVAGFLLLLALRVAGPPSSKSLGFTDLATRRAREDHAEQRVVVRF